MADDVRTMPAFLVGGKRHDVQVKGQVVLAALAFSRRVFIQPH